MHKHVLFFTLFILSFATFSQTEASVKTSESYVPINCLTEYIYIEKYEPITSYEIANAINNRENSSKNDSTLGKTQILEGADFFNLILYRKINNQIDELTSETKDTLINTVHSRDRKENVDGNYRYLILSDFNFTAFDDKSEIEAGYYIYDQETKTKYQTYPTVESLLSAVNLARKKSSRMDQEYLDYYLERFNQRDFERAYKTSKKASPGTVLYTLLIAIVITLATIF